MKPSTASIGISGTFWANAWAASSWPAQAKVKAAAIAAQYRLECCLMGISKQGLFEPCSVKAGPGHCQIEPGAGRP